MRLPLIFLALTASLGAQPVSLEGEWRWHAGDDPRFAARDWDDSAWTARLLPRRDQIPAGIAWFRRHAVAPSTTGPLALAVGSYSFCGEAFVNGTMVGRVPCRPGEDPPFFAPRVHPLPEGLIQPGQPFVVALRAEHRFALWGNASFLLDEGPYLLADRATAELAAKAALGRLQRNSSSFIVFAWTALGIAGLLLVLWATNPQRRELLWFGLFQLCIAAFSGSQLWFVFGAEVPRAIFTWSVPTAFLFLSAAVHQVLFGRDLSPRGWTGVALLTLGSRLALPGFTWQVPANVLPLIWAARRVRSPHLPDRLFAVAVLIYSLMGINSAISRTFPGIWPVPGAFWIGSFMIVTISAVNAVLSSVMLVLLILRLGEDRREKQRLAGELAAAAQIQSLLLPAGSAEGVDAVYHPAAEVGGDFYQILDRADGSRLIVIGDVSGKGLKAAMLVSVVIGALRQSEESAPGAILAGLNRVLHGQTGGGFVTALCARFSPVGEVIVANAGHLAPYVDGQEAAVDSGLPLGLVPETEYAETALSGCAFTFVTDGVVEAANTQGELFGFDRTREISGQPAAEIAEAARAWGQNDDITVVTVRRTA
jgi:hypothetical protein